MVDAKAKMMVISSAMAQRFEAKTSVMLPMEARVLIDLILSTARLTIKQR